MKRIGRGFLAAAVAGTLWACSLSPNGAAAVEAVYEVPLDRAREIMASAHEPPMVFGDGQVDMRLRLDTPQRLQWSVNQRGIEVMRYTADLTEASAGSTKVSLTLTGTASSEFGNVEERLARKRSVRTLYLVAMEERIAADLQGRAYDMTRLYPALARATLDNLDMFTPPKDRSREIMNKAYRDELEAGRNS